MRVERESTNLILLISRSGIDDCEFILGYRNDCMANKKTQCDAT